MSDLISRQAAIDYVDDVPYIKDHPNIALLWKAWVEQLPSAQPDLSGYSDRLWKAAYERGKAEAQRTGKWIDCDGGIATCSACGDRWGVYGVMKFCPNCGAKMEDENGN